MRREDRILVLAPHPDDESLGTAGLLQHAVAVGAAVRVVYATDGENNPWAQRAAERRWWVGDEDRVRWASVRRREAVAALGRLGVSRDVVTFLGLPDQGLMAVLLNDADRAVDALARAIACDPPTVLAAPTTFDLHPDHSALAVLLRLAIRRLKLSMRRPLVIEYLIHGRRRSTGALEPSWHIALSAEQMLRKRAAIRAHASQLVLRRRGLLAFATPREPYHSPGRLPAVASDAAHPIRAAWVDGQTLRLRLRQRARLGAFGRTTLYLAVDRRGGTACWRAVLPSAAASIGKIRLVSGTCIVPAVSEWSSQGRELRLPVGIVRGARAVFVKLERRFGFYDEAGWCELAVACPRRSTSATTVPIAERRREIPGRATARQRARVRNTAAQRLRLRIDEP